MFDLSGKVAVVTGGNGGIGLGMAGGLSRAGAQVVVCGRDAAKSRAAVDQLERAGGTASAIEADLTREDDVRRLIEQVFARHGRLDILVNNAGTNIRKAPHEATLAEWHAVMDINLTSAFLCSREAWKPMQAGGGGKVINIGSVMSLLGAPYAPAYAASKGGIVQLTRSQATAWAGDNIQVNAVLPGWIDTDLTRKARDQVPGLHDRVIARTPVKRWGTPEDLAGVAVFLASSASDFVTGAAIPVDGGYTVLA